MTEMNKPVLKCPDCEGTNITSCPGGTCYKPDEWAKRNIKYICMDCLCEFGDPGSSESSGANAPQSLLQPFKPSLIECSNFFCRDLNGSRRLWIAGLDDVLNPGVCPWCGKNQ